jgi:hypothetical protein
MPAPARFVTMVHMDLTTPPPSPAPAPRPTRPATGTGGWIALALLSLAISLPTDLLLSVVYSTTCGQPADPDSVVEGRVLMLIVLLVAALPWMLALPTWRTTTSGTTVALIGVVALLPAVAFLLHGFTAGAWTSSLCLGG